MPMNLEQPTRETRQPVEAVGRRHRLHDLLTDEETYATTLLVLFIDRFGTEGLTWHPSTIDREMRTEFGVELPKALFDKLMAAITLVTTNYFYKDTGKFIEICNILSGDDFDPAMFDPADTAECAWGLTEAMLISPPEEDEPFDPQIIGYVNEVLKAEGYIQPPDILKLGLDAGLQSRVNADFADDPEIFQAIYETQRSKADEVTNVVRENLNDLIAQVRSLPLKEGDTTDMLNRLRNKYA